LYESWYEYIMSTHPSRVMAMKMVRNACPMSSNERMSLAGLGYRKSAVSPVV